MISPFLKKLLFARQFSMENGKIEILGKTQVLLPGDVIYEMEKLNPKTVYKSVKSTMKKDIEDYAKKLGSTGEGMLRILGEIFETFGLGEIEIIDLDNKKKRCILRINNSTLASMSSGKDGAVITPAILSGMFSFLFKKNVDAKKSNKSIGMDYLEYVVK